MRDGRVVSMDRIASTTTPSPSAARSGSTLCTRTWSSSLWFADPSQGANRAKPRQHRHDDATGARARKNRGRTGGTRKRKSERSAFAVSCTVLPAFPQPKVAWVNYRTPTSTSGTALSLSAWTTDAPLNMNLYDLHDRKTFFLRFFRRVLRLHAFNTWLNQNQPSCP